MATDPLGPLPDDLDAGEQAKHDERDQDLAPPQVVPKPVTEGEAQSVREGGRPNGGDLDPAPVEQVVDQDLLTVVSREDQHQKGIPSGAVVVDASGQAFWYSPPGPVTTAAGTGADRYRPLFPSMTPRARTTRRPV